MSEQFTREDRMRAMDVALNLLAGASVVIARELSGQATGPFTRHLRNAVDDAIRTAVLDADLPVWATWQERAEEERAWEEAEARRAA